MTAPPAARCRVSWRSMRTRRLAALAVSALAAACGGGEAGAPSARPEAAKPSADRVRIEAPRPQSSIAPEEIERLIAAWRAAAGWDAKRPAADALVARGPAAAERVVALLGDQDAFETHFNELFELVRQFGADAVPAILRLVETGDTRVRWNAMMPLSDMASVWAFGEHGAAMCRALLAISNLDPANDETLGLVDQSLRLLALSRPAGGAIAADLARAWATDPVMSEARAEALVSLGPDARDAIPVVRSVLLADVEPAAVSDDALRRTQALLILAAVGEPDASLVDPLVRIATSGSDEERSAALRCLAALGGAPASAAKDLVPLLRSEDHEVSNAAWNVLAAMPSIDDATWNQLIASPGSSFYGRLADPTFAARLVESIPRLSREAVGNAMEVLAYVREDELASLLPPLLRHPFPEGRVCGVAVWERIDMSPPPLLTELLGDPDPVVRAHVTRAMAERGALPDGRLRDMAVELSGSGVTEARVEALSALGSLAERDASLVPAILRAARDADWEVRRAAIRAIPDAAADDSDARAVLLRALEDEDNGMRDAAARSLASHAGLSSPVRAAVRSALLAELSNQHNPATADAIVRLGGRDDLVAWIRRGLLEWVQRDEALDVAIHLARTDPEIRSVLTGAVEGLDASGRSDVEDALARIDFARATDPVAIARGSGLEEHKVERLSALGAPGLRAIVLLAGITKREANLLEGVADLPLRDAIADASGSSGSDDDAKALRVGAAVLARTLPDPEALVVLARLAEDPGARLAVVRSLCEVERRSKGAVPTALAARLLRGADGKRSWTGLRLAELMGTRAANCDRELLADLRRIRDTGPVSRRARTAAALWYLVRDEKEALPTLRTLLARPERMAEGFPWSSVGPALAEMRLGPDDMAAMLPTIRAIACDCAPPEMNQELGPGPGDAVRGAMDALLPVVERHAMLATSAARELGMIVARWGAWRDGPGGCAARALAGMGAAARDALPDLRRGVLVHGDAHGVLRDAIRAIESRGR